MKVTGLPPGFSLLDEIKDLRRLALQRRAASLDSFRRRARLLARRTPSPEPPLGEAAPYATPERPSVIAD